MKMLENLWHSSETFGKLRKQFKSAFQCFYDFLTFSENLWKCSEIFGKLQKRFKNNLQMFYDFLKFSGNLRKSSEVFGNLRKRFPDVIGNVRNGSQELKGFGARF